MKKRTPELFELIERYLDNTLSDHEKRAFEERLHSDPELETEVEKHRQLHSMMQDMDAIDFRRKVQQLGTDEEGKRMAGAQYSGKTVIRIAASLAVLIALSALWWITSEGSEKNLYENYFEPYPVEDVVRGELEQEVKETMASYAEKKYGEVIPQLVSLIENNPNRLDFRLFLGCSYLQTNQEQNAIGVFREAKKLNGYSESAQWYLALAYLKNNNNEKVATELEELIQYDGIYKDNAQALLNQIIKQNSE